MSRILALLSSAMLAILFSWSAYGVELAEVDEQGRCLNGSECGPDNGWYNRLPAQAQVSVSQQQVMVRFRWDEDPMFTVGEAFELSVTFLPHDQCKDGERYKLFASPYPDGTDWDGPYETSYYSFTYIDVDGVEKLVPESYRDAGNFTTSKWPWEVSGAVDYYCDHQQLLATDAIKVAAAIAKTADKVKEGKYQFAVGTSSPERLKQGVWYTITYKLRLGDCPVGHVVIVGQAVKDRNMNIIDCPFTNGTWDPPSGEQKECGCSREWIHKLCVPTGTFSFVPSEAYSLGSGCDDFDGDNKFGVEALSYDSTTPNPHYGSNVGDCNDCDGRIGTTGYKATLPDADGQQHEFGACVYGEVGEYNPGERHDPATSAFVGAYLYHGGVSALGNPSGYVHTWGTDAVDNPLLVQDFVRVSDGNWSMLIHNATQGMVHPLHGQILYRFANCKNGTGGPNNGPLNTQNDCAGITDYGAPRWQETYCTSSLAPGNTTRYIKQLFERGALCYDSTTGTFLNQTNCNACVAQEEPQGNQTCGTGVHIALDDDIQPPAPQAPPRGAYTYLGATSCTRTSGGADTNWRFTCDDPADSFNEGDAPLVLAGFQNLAYNHSFRADIYRDGVLLAQDGPTSWNNVGTGWQYAYYWAHVPNPRAGSYTVRVFIQEDGDPDFTYVGEKTFAVRPVPDYVVDSVVSCTQKVDGTAANGWVFSCVNPRTTFSPGDNVITLLGLKNIRKNHRYRATIYRNGMVIRTDGPTPWNNVGTGWQRGYYWPTMWHAVPGDYSVNMEVDSGTGFKPVQSHYFTVNGPLYTFAGADTCSRIAGPIQPGWYYNCEGSRTTFAYGQTAYVMAGFENLYADHRYKSVNYLNGRYQWEWATPWNRVGAWGWPRGYFWPTFTRPRHGNWVSKIYIDTGFGFQFITEKSFTVEPPSYEFMSAQACHDVSGGENTGWVFSCVGPASAFNLGEAVHVLAGFRNLTRDHRFMAAAWKDNLFQWNYTTDWNRVGEWGWDYAFFFPTLWDSRGPGPGTWRFDISIDVGDGQGFKLVTRPTFTVR